MDRRRRTVDENDQRNDLVDDGVAVDNDVEERAYQNPFILNVLRTMASIFQTSA